MKNNSFYFAARGNHHPGEWSGAVSMWRDGHAKGSFCPFRHRGGSSTLSIEKGREVLYRDFVTILRDASMQYITKLVTSQRQKPRSPTPKLQYNVPDRRTRADGLKFLLCTKYCWQALGQNAQPCKVPVNIYLNFHLLISVCPKTKPFKGTYMEMKIF